MSDEDLKKKIDAMNYEQLLRRWRNAPVGDPFFQGEVGAYYTERMNKLREEGADHTGASKNIGWEG